MTLRSMVDNDAVSPLEVIPFEKRSHNDTSRPWLFSNMVTSLDGAAAVDGLSGPMGDNDDRQMFRALRASADAIIVGAATANAEGYRPPQRSSDVDEVRTRAGRQSRPLIVVISASLSIDPTLELFNDPTYRPLILTTDRADQHVVAELGDRADIVSLGADQVNLADAIQHLGAAGHHSILSEGGPTVNGQLVRAGLIDEWNLTLAPMLVGGSAPRPAREPRTNTASTSTTQPQRPSANVEVNATDLPPDYDLTRLWRGERALFMRWVRPS